MTSVISSGRQVSSPTESLDALRRRIEGVILTHEAEGYDEARGRVAIQGVAGRPDVIVQVASSSDVVEAVRFARAQGRPVAVRSGGHSLGGYSMVEGAIVVDFSQMKAVTIDAEVRTARVQAGATTNDIMHPAHAYGLALSTGDTRTVGVGGLTTGGGIGFMARKYGLAIDNLLSARVVTAEGELVTASAHEHPDLFWAIRGGGGNFGIITEFEFQLAQVGQVLAGALVLPATREVIRGYLDYSVEAPDGLTTLVNLMHAPPAPFIPEERVGEPVVMILAIWAGDLAEGERALAPLRALAEPVVDVIEPIPYPAMYQFTAPYELPHTLSIRSMFADEHSDATIDAMLESMESAPGPLCIVHLRGLGGALARVAPDATAFAHRERRFFTTILGVNTDLEADTAPFEAWTESLWDKIRGERRGVYVNFLSREGDERVHEAYPPATYDRLIEVKRRYDPDNVFRFNQNITPQN